MPNPGKNLREIISEEKMQRQVTDYLLQGRAAQNPQEKPGGFPRVINELLDVLVEVHLSEHGNGPIQPNRENQK